MANEAIQQTILKTATLGKIGFGPNELAEYVEKHPGETNIVNVMAFVSGYEVVPNKQDPSKSSIRFSGQFEFANRITGEDCIAGSAFVPGPAENFLRGKKEGEEGAIRIAFMVTVKKVDRKIASTGYVFGMKGFKSTDVSTDPFAEMRDLFPAAKSLPAGKAAKELSKA